MDSASGIFTPLTLNEGQEEYSNDHTTVIIVPRIIVSIYAISTLRM